MQILVSGAGGLIGSALTPALRSAGHSVVRLMRPDSELVSSLAAIRSVSTAQSPDQSLRVVSWDPGTGFINDDELEAAGPIDAVVHLAGAGIADRRWTPQRKQLILESRIKSTTLLCETLGACSAPPSLFLCASAVGFYGNRGDERLDESSSPATDRGFAAEVVQAWESSTSALEHTSTQCALMRLGIVLSAEGGALAAQLPFFKLGLGGRIGSGQQWMSWITLHDALRAILWLLEHPVQGPVNLTSPNPVTNATFTKALGQALRRPTLIPIPKPVLWLRLGRELTTELLEASVHVCPAVLLESGFVFEHPRIADAFGALFD